MEWERVAERVCGGKNQERVERRSEERRRQRLGLCVPPFFCVFRFVSALSRSRRKQTTKDRSSNANSNKQQTNNATHTQTTQKKHTQTKKKQTTNKATPRPPLFPSTPPSSSRSKQQQTFHAPQLPKHTPPSSLLLPLVRLVPLAPFPPLPFRPSVRSSFDADLSLLGASLNNNNHNSSLNINRPRPPVFRL